MLSKIEPPEPKMDPEHLYYNYIRLTEKRERTYQALRTSKLQPWLYSQYLLDSAVPPQAEGETKKI